MRLLVVVAHPDDESFGCGSLLAWASARGWETAVLCATRGEAGESRIATDDVGALREGELRAAARILGVGEVRVMGYVDSGMDGTAPPGTLVAADPLEVAGRIRDVVDELRPTVVVTLDGSDGHRDHLAMRDATMSAVDTAEHPPRAVYTWCLARSTMARWVEHMRSVGGGEAYTTLGDLGTPDDEITSVLDVSAFVEQRWQAIRAHASQASPYDELPPGLAHDFLGTDRLRLVRGDELISP